MCAYFKIDSRCTYKCEKAATGPLDRKKLLEFINDQVFPAYRGLGLVYLQEPTLWKCLQPLCRNLSIFLVKNGHVTWCSLSEVSSIEWIEAENIFIRLGPSSLSNCLICTSDFFANSLLSQLGLSRAELQSIFLIENPRRTFFRPHHWKIEIEKQRRVWPSGIRTNDLWLCGLL